MATRLTQVEGQWVNIHTEDGDFHAPIVRAYEFRKEFMDALEVSGYSFIPGEEGRKFKMRHLDDVWLIFAPLLGRVLVQVQLHSSSVIGRQVTSFWLDAPLGVMIPHPLHGSEPQPSFYLFTGLQIHEFYKAIVQVAVSDEEINQYVSDAMISGARIGR